MIAANKLLTPSQLEIVRKRSDIKGVAMALHAWAVIFGMMALFVWMPNPITFIAAVVVIGGRQLGLAILMHDGAHGILCENQKLNYYVSQWLCAYPMMAETGAYRRLAAGTTPAPFLVKARPLCRGQSADLLHSGGERPLVSLFRAVAAAFPDMATGYHAHPQYRRTRDGA